MDIDHRLPIEREREDVYGTQECRYRSAVTALLCEGTFCAEDALVLEGYRSYLGLPRAAAEEFFRDECGAYIRYRLTKAFGDGYVSPSEDATLAELVRSVGLGPQWDSDTDRALVGARHAWAVDHGPLPSVPTDLGLLGDEVAHAVADCEAFENRERTVGVSYAGLTFSIPIVPGMRFRVGQLAVDRQNLSYSHKLGTGDLTVTSKRLIFRSPERAITAKLTSIIDIEAYTDAVTVQRTQGKPITFVLDITDADFAVILGRAWQAARA